MHIFFVSPLKIDFEQIDLYISHCLMQIKEIIEKNPNKCEQLTAKYILVQNSDIIWIFLSLNAFILTTELN